MLDNSVETTVQVIDLQWVQNSFMQYKFRIQIIIDNKDVRYETVINKRYSDFLQLQTDMLKELGVKQCPFDLPTKTYSLWSRAKMYDTNSELIIQRKAQLSKYLYDILNNSFDVKWRDSLAVTNFLSLPSEGPHMNWSTLVKEERRKQQQGHIEDDAVNADNWLIQFRNCKNDLLQCQQSHNINDLMKLRLKINSLQSKIESPTITHTELIRRQNLLKLLKDDITELSLNSSSSSSSLRPHQTEEGTPFNGGDGGGNINIKSTIKKPISNGRRRFGETAQTQELDNTELYQYNKTVLKQQDQDLEQLHAMIQRQKTLSLAMNDELKQQNEMLDEFETDVSRIGGKLNKTNDRATKFNRS